MRKIGLLGGSFNPAHNGHIHISLQAKKRLGLNQIWWLPTVQNPLKNDIVGNSLNSRANYCQEFIKESSLNSQTIKVIIIKYKYAFELVKLLKARYKNCDFYWIMGADNVHNLHLWKNYYNFLKSAKFTIFARNSDLLFIKKAKSWKALNAQGVNIFFTPKLNISSTFIRNSHV